MKISTLLLALAAVACTKNKAPEPAATASRLAPPAAPAPAEQTVNLYIWANYTSKELLDEFTKKTGIKVQESNFGSNEELLAKLQAGGTGFDVAVPSDYMVAVMNKLQLLETLDKAKIPNAQNLDPQFLGKDFDAGNAVSLPYAWSITGIAVNRDAYKEPVTSWADLFQNDKAKGKISLLDDVRECLGAALKLQGASLNSTDPAALSKAKELLIAAKKNVKAFNSSPIDQIKSGDVALAHMYSQEANLAARDSGGKVAFVVPKEGATMAIDNMVILKSAPHKEQAYKLMNFLLEAKVNADFVQRTLAGPVLTATKAALPPALQASPVLYPQPDIVAKFEMMKDLGDTTTLYDRIWSEVKVSSH